MIASPLQTVAAEQRYQLLLLVLLLVFAIRIHRRPLSFITTMVTTHNSDSNSDSNLLQELFDEAEEEEEEDQAILAVVMSAVLLFSLTREKALISDAAWIGQTMLLNSTVKDQILFSDCIGCTTILT